MVEGSDASFDVSYVNFYEASQFSTSWLHSLSLSRARAVSLSRSLSLSLCPSSYSQCCQEITGRRLCCVDKRSFSLLRHPFLHNHPPYASGSLGTLFHACPRVISLRSRVSRSVLPIFFLFIPLFLFPFSLYISFHLFVCFPPSFPFPSI